jgi:putative nucleotidyltransferase with HDIG domain
MFTTLDSEDFTMLDFWRHALGTAVCCEVLAKRLKYPKPEMAFTCGLLHDIGKLVLHEIDHDRLGVILAKTKESGLSFVEVERQWELPGHSFLGEVIATKWGLPQVIRLAIRYHHFDVSKMDSILASAKPVIHMVRLANQLCVKNQIGKSGDCSKGEITKDMFSNLGMVEGDIEEIEQETLKMMEGAGAFLSAVRS